MTLQWKRHRGVFIVGKWRDMFVIELARYGQLHVFVYPHELTRVP